MKWKEPAVNRMLLVYDKKTGEYIFYDCSAESPKDRRSLCYDREALESRKEHKPEDSAIDMAAAMGIELLTEEQYRELQQLGNFDMKTSSWVKTLLSIRKLGGASFVIVATTMSSCITTVQNLTMPPGVSVAGSKSEFFIAWYDSSFLKMRYFQWPNNSKMETNNATIFVEAIIDAPPEKVWKAWTDPSFIMNWFGSDPNGNVSDAKLDVRPGGYFEITFSDADLTEHS